MTRGVVILHKFQNGALFTLSNIVLNPVNRNHQRHLGPEVGAVQRPVLNGLSHMTTFDVLASRQVGNRA